MNTKKTTTSINLLNTRELQNVLNIGRDMAYALMRSPSFPSMRLGDRYYVAEDALTEWISKNQHRQILL